MFEISAMFPVFVSDKLAELAAFYQHHFGFEAVFFDQQFYLHLAHSSSGMQLGFLAANHASQPEYLHARTVVEGVAISFEVADAKAAYNLAVEQELDFALHYTEESWGQHHFIVRDPHGFYVDVVEHVN